MFENFLDEPFCAAVYSMALSLLTKGKITEKELMDYLDYDPGLIHRALCTLSMHQYIAYDPEKGTYQITVDPAETTNQEIWNVINGDKKFHLCATIKVTQYSKDGQKLGEYHPDEDQMNEIDRNVEQRLMNKTLQGFVDYLNEPDEEDQD